MDVASLDLSVKATGLKPAAASLEALGKAASTYKKDIATLDKTLQELSKKKLPTLGKGITQFKNLAASMNGLKGATTSFSKLSIAADKLVGKSAGLAEVAKHLKSIQKSVSGMAGVSLAGITGTGSSGGGGGSRSSVDPTAKAQQTLMRQIEREGLMASTGYNKAAYLEQRAAMLGVSEAAKPYIAQMKAAQSTTNSGTISTRQYNAALRMVPAQFTDIATQLAGGQNPFLILLQQGGQLRDMFGGFGTMFRAVGGQLAKLLTNPFTILAVAIGSVGYVMYQAAKANTEFSKTAVLLGGNVTATKISIQASALAASNMGTAISDASTVIHDFASRSVVANTSLASVTATAVKFSDVVGVDLKTAMGDYIGLSEKASEKLIDLDKKYHFLTTSIFAQVVALEAQGRQMDAVALANTELQKAQATMTAEMMANLGSIERGWIAVKKWVVEVKDSILSIGATATVAQEYAKQQAKVAKMEADIKNAWIYKLDASGAIKKNDEQTLALEREKLNILGRQISESERTAALEEQKRYETSQVVALQKNLESGLSNETKLRQFNERVAAATVEHWKTTERTAKAEAEWNQKIKEEKDKLFPTAQKLSKEAKKQSDEAAKLAEREEKYQQKQQGLLATLNEKIKYAKQENEALKENESNANKINEHLTKAAEYEAKAALETDKKKQNDLYILAVKEQYLGLLEQENTKQKAIKESYLAYVTANEQFKQNLASINDEYAREVSYLTMTNKEKALAEALAQNEIARKNELLAVDKKVREEESAGNAQAAANYAAQKVDIETLYNRKAELIAKTNALSQQELSWTENLKLSFKQYAEDLGTTNSIMQSSFTSVMNSTQSAVESFVSGTSTSFKDLAVSVLKSISVMLIRIAMLKAAMAAMNMFGSGASTTTVSSAASTGLNSNPSVITYSANGNTFTSSGISKFATGGTFTNSVVNKTTPFAFASGGSFNQGIMGEAGPEAIMPLTRMSNGNLGVQTSGSSGGTQNNVSVVVTVSSDGTADTTASSDSSDAKRLGEMIAAVCKDTIVQQQRPGGLLASR